MQESAKLYSGEDERCPADKEIAEFFYNTGVPTYDCYFFSETSPAVTMNIRNAWRIGSVGKVLEGQKVVIDRSAVEDGAQDGLGPSGNERIQVSESNAKAVEGENLAKITIANSEAELREKEAEANRKAIVAEKVQAAKALEEAYVSENYLGEPINSELAAAVQEEVKEDFSEEIKEDIN